MEPYCYITYFYIYNSLSCHFKDDLYDNFQLPAGYLGLSLGFTMAPVDITLDCTPYIHTHLVAKQKVVGKDPKMLSMQNCQGKKCSYSGLPKHDTKSYLYLKVD